MRRLSKSSLVDQITIKVPASSIKKMKAYDGSVRRETKHFSSTTTLHGPKRMFYAKKWARLFWIVIVAIAWALLFFQIYLLLDMYYSKPTVAQVSFIVNEGGMEFPAITVCNFNKARRKNVAQMNSSGDLSASTLEYLLQTNTNTMFLFSNSDLAILEKGHKEAETFLAKHPDFNVIQFFKQIGYDCDDLFLTCYFGGKRFNCCKYMQPKVTSFGKCFLLDFQQNAPEWMKKQISPRAEAGLRIIADTHLEEQFLNDDDDYTNDIFSDLFENGFRYYIHPSGTNPELESEGVSVSPSWTSYSALKTTTHNLLNRKKWGNCTEDWPKGFNTILPYSASACRSLCIAQYFFDLCGCSPFTYNVDGKNKICKPFETVTCMSTHMLKNDNSTDYVDFPSCSECHMECQSTSYNSFNSYGDDFNKESLEWLIKLENRTKQHIIENVAVINIFFLEMFYTSYTQVQATSFTEVLSNIGGNMGMFLGMSVVTITELTLFATKIFWIIVSKRRRQYMYSKKKDEKEKELNIDEAIRDLHMRKSRRASRDSGYRDSPMDDSSHSFGYINSEASLSNASLESMIELKLDVKELQRKLNSSSGVQRIRLPSEKSRYRKQNQKMDVNLENNSNPISTVFTINPNT